MRASTGLSSLGEQGTGSSKALGSLPPIEDSVTSTIPVGNLSMPGQAVLDPTTGNLFVLSDSNLVVIDGSTNAVVTTLSLPGTYYADLGLLLDPTAEQLYVPAFNSVYVVSASNYSIVRQIALPGLPQGVPILNPLNGNVYCPWSNGLAVISASNYTVVSTLPFSGGLGGGPAAYDPYNEEIYVEGLGPGYQPAIWIMSASNNSLLKLLSLPGDWYMQPPSFDPSNGEVFIVNHGSNNVTVLNGSSNTVATSIPLTAGSDPETPVFDPANGNLYVPGYLNGGLSVISGETNSVVGMIYTGYPRGVGATGVYDPANGNLYFVGVQAYQAPNFAPNLTSTCHNNSSWERYFSQHVLSEVSSVTDTVIATIPLPFGFTNGAGFPTYDPGNRELYISGVGYDNGSGSGRPLIAVVSTTPSSQLFRVTITEAGLPPNPDPSSTNVSNSSWTWSTLVNQTYVPTTMSSISLWESNGSYAFSTWWGPYGPVNGTFVISGGPVVVNVTLVPRIVQATFTETGLLSSLSWQLVLNGTVLSSSGGNVTACTTLGSTYTYVILGPAGYVVQAANTSQIGLKWGIASSGPAAGNLTIGASGGSFTVQFVPGKTDLLAFREAGLPIGTRWCAFVGLEKCSVQRNLVVGNLTPGSYPYSVVNEPGFSERVSHGGHAMAHAGWIHLGARSIHVKAKFTVYRGFGITFIPGGTGVPAIEQWSVKLQPGRTWIASNGDSDLLTTSLANGTYNYTVRARGFDAIHGSATVSGSTPAVVLDFVQVTYIASFEETGLSGQSWTVYLNGTSFGWINRTESGTGAFLNFSGVPNGTYSFWVSPPSGYHVKRPLPPHFVIHVKGHSIVRKIVFQANVQVSPLADTTARANPREFGSYS